MARSVASIQADIDALRAAIATGARRVRYSDGSEVEYRSLLEMKQALAMLEAELSVANNVKPVRSFRGGYMKSGY